MAKIRKRKCKHCQKHFIPDYRNVKRQKYCGEPECRQASKKASQEKWLSKPENENYFRGSPNVRRVQDWRKARPGYSRKKKDALQDHLPKNTVKNQTVTVDLGSESTSQIDALQDFCKAQPAVFLGLIATFTGSVLQDDIVMTLQRMQNIGIDILNGSSIFDKGGQNGKKTGSLSGTYPQGP